MKVMFGLVQMWLFTLTSAQASCQSKNIAGITGQQLTLAEPQSKCTPLPNVSNKMSQLQIASEDIGVQRTHNRIFLKVQQFIQHWKNQISRHSHAFLLTIFQFSFAFQLSNRACLQKLEGRGMKRNIFSINYQICGIYLTKVFLKFSIGNHLKKFQNNFLNYISTLNEIIQKTMYVTKTKMSKECSVGIFFSLKL